jgi:DNA-binding NtrC family response regulator
MKTLLIVEDELGPRESLKMILGSHYNIEVAENGLKAVDILSKKKIDGVTMDLRLPGPCGIEVLKQIKLKFPAIEVLVITGYGTLRTALDAMRYGAYNYLLKPFNIDEVVDLIRKMLDRKDQMEEWACFRNGNDGLYKKEVLTSSLSQTVSSLRV